MIAKISIGNNNFIYSNDPEIKNARGIKDILFYYFQNEMRDWAKKQLNTIKPSYMLGNKIYDYTTLMADHESLKLDYEINDIINKEIERFNNSVKCFKPDRLFNGYFEIIGLRVKFLEVM